MQPLGVMARLGLAIHEFAGRILDFAALRSGPPPRNSWTPRPSLGVTRRF